MLRPKPETSLALNDHLSRHCWLQPDQYFFVAYAKRAFRTSFKRQKWPFKRSSNAKTVQYFFGVWDSFDAYASEPQTSLERPKCLVSFVILIGNVAAKKELQAKFIPFQRT